MAIRTAASGELFFRGRPGDLRMGEWVRAVDTLPTIGKNCAAVLFGYPDDEGVKKNRGRPGAAKGPESIRRHFYKMTLPADRRWEDRFALFDFGDCVVTPSLTGTHRNAADLAAMVAASGATGVALGGGHDFAAPTFQGFHSAAPKARWGLINIDPHLDTRELESEEAHSGNPFRVLLDGGDLRGSDLAQFGARVNRNPRSSWEYCKKKKVEILTFEEIRSRKGDAPSTFSALLTKLVRRCRFVGVTIDMDTCSDAEGTSAAPVLGFSAWELCRFAAIAGKNPKVRYLEIAETAPGLDSAERSSRIAAEVTFAFLEARSRLT